MTAKNIVAMVAIHAVSAIASADMIISLTSNNHIVSAIACENINACIAFNSGSE